MWLKKRHRLEKVGAGALALQQSAFGVGGTARRFRLGVRAPRFQGQRGRVDSLLAEAGF
jgi:hypothetical protein